MSYDLEQENKEILARYKDLISNTYRTLDEENNKLIRKAFDIALDAHKDQRRKSGEPYIYHPIAVAKIVATEIGLGRCISLSRDCVSRLYTFHLVCERKKKQRENRPE